MKKQNILVPSASLATVYHAIKYSGIHKQYSYNISL